MQLEKLQTEKQYGRLYRSCKLKELIIILISRVLTEPEKPELNTTLNLFVCLLFRVQKSLVDYALNNWVGVRSV